MATAKIDVRLRPRGRRDELLGIREGVLQARVAAPPVDGQANRALCRLIARRLRVAQSKVAIVRGEKSRNKVVAVEGVSSFALRQALHEPDR
jgi:uncharacterized protein (TIGR00251 family)